MKTTMIMFFCAMGMSAACWAGGDDFDLLELQQRALRGDAQAALRVADYYRHDGSECCGSSFWVYKLGEVGNDSDKLYAASLLYGEDPVACKAAHKLISLIQDRVKYRTQIEEIETDIAVFDRENEAVRQARVAIRRRAHGLVDENAPIKSSNGADQKPAQETSGSK